MKLYTCGQGEHGANFGHPCGRAARALRQAGYEDFEVETVPGYKLMPWTRRGDARTKIRELSGQDDVPVLVTDDGEVVSGTGTIKAWAQQHPAG